MPFGADDLFHGMPVYYKNTAIKKFYTQPQMSNHIQQILAPLSPFILSNDNRIAQRRQDNTQIGAVGPTIVELYEYNLYHIQAAQIGDYIFS